MSRENEQRPNGMVAGLPQEGRTEPAARRSPDGLFELLDPQPAVAVAESEYWRLLGYPHEGCPSERALELAAWARTWYTENAHPWIYLREATLESAGDALRLDGIAFNSAQLRDHLKLAGARRAMLVAVSAGRDCEAHARVLWHEGKPDEYFFLEMFGSAVVEHLMATMNGRICDLAEREGLMAIPHYSPGYAGWDVAEQNKLFDVIASGLSQPWPEPFEVLSSGMLRPKKSLLAVVGLAVRDAQALPPARWIPCEGCGFSPCQYRRRPYRHERRETAAPPPARSVSEGVATNPLHRDAIYTVGLRALQKWANERVQLEQSVDGSIKACFHFDGTTCSSMGRPLAFDYVVELSPASAGYVIRRAQCRPAADDEGHRFMCAYQSDGPALMQAIASETPLIGRPLNDVLSWSRASAPSGCHCTTASRAHKWGLALEAIHYTLAQRPVSLLPR